MTISATTQGVKPGVCLSTNKPVNPFDGQVIYMTDVDQTAVWDGTQWTVLAPIAGNRNVIINGDFKVWQRATSFTDCAFGLTVDRWEAGRGGFASGLTVSRQTGPTNFQYCARVQRASGNTSTQNIRFATTLETVNSLPLAGKTVTVSFYARAGANFSTSSSQIEVYLRSGTTTDAGRIGAGDTFGTGAATPVSLTQPLTTSWQRFSVSGSVASTATQLALIVYASPTGTAGADDWYEIAGVQVEAGAVATPFEFEQYSETLFKCQRYYEKTYNIGTNPATATQLGMVGNDITASANHSNYIIARFPYKVTKRAAPTVTTYDASGNAGKAMAFNVGAAGTDNFTVTADFVGEHSFRAYLLGINSAGFTIHYTANAEL